MVLKNFAKLNSDSPDSFSFRLQIVGQIVDIALSLRIVVDRQIKKTGFGSLPHLS